MRDTKSPSPVKGQKAERRLPKDRGRDLRRHVDLDKVCDSGLSKKMSTSQLELGVGIFAF
jgi:hypothetical protein